MGCLVFCSLSNQLYTHGTKACRKTLPVKCLGVYVVDSLNTAMFTPITAAITLATIAFN